MIPSCVDRGIGGCALNKQGRGYHEALLAGSIQTGNIQKPV